MEQQYSEKPALAIRKITTITGSTNDSQAFSAKEYLAQTWSATGKDLMALIVNNFSNMADGLASGKGFSFYIPILKQFINTL